VKRISLIVTVLLSAGLVLVANDEPAVRDLKSFLKRLQSPEHLAGRESGHTALSSTWDRTGGNKDGTDFKRIEDGRNVLLDVDGPGCIHRIFTGKVDNDLAKTRIRMYFDNSPSPALDLEVNAFFDFKTGPLPFPLVFHKTYPGTIFPIPFEKHCRVELFYPSSASSPGKAWGNYWQITYTTYFKNTTVKTLEWPLAKSDRNVLEQTCRKLLEAESRPPPAPASWAIRRTIKLSPGSSQRENIPGSGVIRQLRLFTTPHTPAILQNVIMRLEWDNRRKPSVSVPIGYFFGHAETGHAAAYYSLLMGVTKDYAYCTFPMPFDKGAVVSFENHSEQNVKLDLFVDVKRSETRFRDLGRFHAALEETEVEEGWANISRVPRYGPKSLPVHAVLDVADTQGKYVGVFLHVDWPLATWWGEGDWLIWTDQDGWPPDYHGTGTEEYFNCGWGRFDRKAMSGIIKEPAMWPGHVGVYSFHLNDTFSFEHNARVVVEIWPLEPARPKLPHAFWRSTAYWYEFDRP